MRTVYMNGQFVPEADAKLSIYDLSVMQAAAAFEMTRSFNGKHFKLTEHIERLKRSCELLSIPLPEDLQWIEDCLIPEITEQNDHGPGEEHRLLIVVSPGAAPIYRDIAGTINHPFLYIADFPLRYTVKGFSKYFTEGVHCVTSKVQQVPDLCVPSAAKHRSRLHFHLAQMQAPEGTWPLMMDRKQRYCEAPGANLFYVDMSGTPRSCNTAALPGISLATAIEITRAIPGSLHHESAWMMPEILLTGTPFCALPVVSLDGKQIGDGKPGIWYRAMMKVWSELVGVDIQQQIEQWDSQA